MFQEDLARADAYGLISQLFTAPPDDAFLRLYRPLPADPNVKFTLHEPERAGYDGALRRFQAACGTHTADTISEEFERLFGRLRKTVSAPAAPGALAALRDHLQACGLTSQKAALAVELYVSGVCDVQRWLIEHDRPKTVQQMFFDEFVDGGISTICDAIEAAPEARFYRAVANLARAFIEDERSRMR